MHVYSPQQTLFVQHRSYMVKSSIDVLADTPRDVFRPLLLKFPPWMKAYINFTFRGTPS